MYLFIPKFFELKSKGAKITVKFATTLQTQPTAIQPYHLDKKDNYEEGKT